MAPSVSSAATPLLTGSGSASRMAYMVSPPTTVATTAWGFTIRASSSFMAPSTLLCAIAMASAYLASPSRKGLSTSRRRQSPPPHLCSHHSR